LILITFWMSFLAFFLLMVVYPTKSPFSLIFLYSISPQPSDARPISPRRRDRPPDRDEVVKPGIAQTYPVNRLISNGWSPFMSKIPQIPKSSPLPPRPKKQTLYPVYNLVLYQSPHREEPRGRVERRERGNTLFLSLSCAS